MQYLSDSGKLKTARDMLFKVPPGDSIDSLVGTHDTT
jgi:hypothetical protein